MKRDLKFFMQLFIHTFKLSAFTFGGGYVIIPLMKKQFVEKLGWIEEEEMLDFTAIAQSSPGAMAVNASVLLGHHLAGLPGALVAIFGTILPPLILLTIISVGYSAFIENKDVQNVLRGMQAGVCAVIINVVYDMSKLIIKNKKLLPIVLMISAFISVGIFKINAALVIIICAFIGLLSVVRENRKEGKNDTA